MERALIFSETDGYPMLRIMAVFLTLISVQASTAENYAICEPQYAYYIDKNGDKTEAPSSGITRLLFDREQLIISRDNGFPSITSHVSGMKLDDEVYIYARYANNFSETFILNGKCGDDMTMRMTVTAEDTLYVYENSCNCPK